EKQEAEAMKLAQDYPAVSPEELNKAPFPFLSFLSQSSGYLTHSPSLLFTPQKKEEK
ncbi:lytic transglycosylase F, partial [Klebsiella pneumoniae]